MNYAVWRRSKLKNKIWHSGHNRHIALLERTQKQVKIGCSVYIYKTTRIHSETILAASPEIQYKGTRCNLQDPALADCKIPGFIFLLSMG